MVRNYKKKGSYKSYSPETIDAAVSAVQTNLMALRGASKEFGIPPTTLHNWVQTKVRVANFEMHFLTLRIELFPSFFFSLCSEFHEESISAVKYSLYLIV